MSHLPRTHEDYQLGVICALATEKAAMVAMLDETHSKLKKENGDENEYTLGRIGVHNVVVACLPAGLMGNGPAAIVAKDMQRSFPIKFGLMVGVGGGVWSKTNDIRLGDIVVSQPTGPHGGVVQWDFGQTVKGGEFRRTGSLDKPPPVLLHALQVLRTFEITDGLKIEESLSLMIRNKPKLGQNFRYQGTDHDQLFEATYGHEGGGTCNKCDPRMIVQRPVRGDIKPRIHYGNIASGNEVMKHGTTRDRIAKEEGVICFEMEAAGLMDSFQCLVIRGICDYADSHKNKIWQPYAAATAAAFARVFLGFIDKQEVIKTLVTPKPMMVLPFGRNKNFVGRQSQLKLLLTILCGENTEEDCQRAAIVGLGGVGKTQIALECAFQLQNIAPGCSVFWVRASDFTSFDNAYYDIGQHLKIPGLGDKKEDARRLVKTWLSQESVGRWLMIVDNADDFEMFYHSDNKESTSTALSEYLPFSRLGAILFTTRDREAAARYAGPNIIDIDEMDDTEARDLLKRNLQNQQLIEDEDGETKLLNLLVNLPLAITQAAAYLNARSCSIAEYLRIYEESSDNVIKLLSKDFQDLRRYPGMKNPVATTWLISFQQIQIRDPVAADYMAFISCVKEQDIPWDLLPQASEFDKTEALGTLKAFGFIRERASLRSFDMHRLVHIAMQSWLKHKGEWRNSNFKALEQISNIFPWPQHENRNVWMAFLPHAQCITAVTRLAEMLPNSEHQYKSIWKRYMALVCNALQSNPVDKFKTARINLAPKVGLCLLSKGRWKEAEELFVQVVQTWMKVFGDEHPGTLTSMADLAFTYQSQGRWKESEELFVRVIQKREKVLFEEDHPDTLASMTNLALTYQNQGRWKEAEDLFIQVIGRSKKLLGEEHPIMLTSMNNLASTYRYQGRWREAETIEIQVIETCKRVLGEEHPNTLASIANLASTYRNQGRWREAEEIQVHVMEARLKVLGKEHPDTVTNMANLASTYWNQGRLKAAEELFAEVIERSRKVLGEEHPVMLTSMNNLASTYWNQGRWKEAEELLIQAIGRSKKLLGEEHPVMLSSMNNLASTYWKQGRRSAAEELFLKVIETRKKVLMEEHPDMLINMANLAFTYQIQGRSKEAEELFTYVIETRKRVLGEEHPSTLKSMANLAYILKSRGCTVEAV